MSFDFARARDNMIEGEVRTNDVTDRRLIKAMRDVARENFVPEDKRLLAYGGMSVPLAGGRHLMDPRSFSKMAQAADIAPKDRVLVVACGYGYSAAVFSRLAGEVVALESLEELARRARQLLADRPNVTLVQSDLRKGAPEQAPYDVIFVDGGVEELPASLTAQLAEGGRLLAIRLKPSGRAWFACKIGGVISERSLFDAAIPLLPGFERAPAFVF